MGYELIGLDMDGTLLNSEKKINSGVILAIKEAIENGKHISLSSGRALAEIEEYREQLKDMESDRPMDRLVCGDVGFGKTEVAVRAAFKAVADNKQVAVLVPTTVLAYQHFHTFRERLKGLLLQGRRTSRQEAVLQVHRRYFQCEGKSHPRQVPES